MAFDSYGAGENSGKSSGREIDFDALNKYVVETANLENREVLIGVISSIVDLGTQEQEDGEMVFKGSEEDEAAEIAKYPGTYFEDGPDPNNPKKQVRLKKWPQKPIQSVAVSVDFPDILLNKGQFFGDDSGELKPLRLWLGGDFFIQDVGKVVGRPTPLKVKKNAAGKWSFDKKHLLYKMAAAAKLIDASKDEVFLPQDIDKLLGKALCFEAQVFFKESKGKEYYTEYAKFVSGLGRGQKAPDFEVSRNLIQFNQDNDPEALKELRAHVKNTIKRAANYEGSKIQAQLEALYKSNGNDSDGSDASDDSKQEEAPKPTAKPKAEPKATKPKKEEKPEIVFDDMDDDVPF
jgi:hypothetical protein